MLGGEGRVGGGLTRIDYWAWRLEGRDVAVRVRAEGKVSTFSRGVGGSTIH